MKKIKYKHIKKILKENKLEIESNLSDDEIFLGIKTITNASKDDLSFLSNSKYLNNLKKINAKACLIENKFKNLLPISCKPIVVKDPYLALAIISNLFEDQNLVSNGLISEKSIINSKSKIKCFYYCK